jgi:Ca-activated chloride channel homolog
MIGRIVALAFGLSLTVDSSDSRVGALAQDRPFDSPAPSLAQDRAVFSARIDGVRVDVLATERSRPVRGLAAADFEVRDNGVLQQIELVSLEQLSLNVVLAFDLSESIRGPRLTSLRGASDALLDTLRPGDRAGLVTFSHAVTLRCRLTLDLRCVRDALASVVPAGETSVVDGAYASLIAGEAEFGRSLVMVFSDRFDTASWLSPSSVVDAAKRSDVVVYGVTAGEGESRFLRDLTTTTGGRLLGGSNQSDLAGAFVKILDEFRQRYVLTYTPRGVADTGWHRLDVRVKRSGVSVRARPGYQRGQ